jgi:hypothetical protein
LYVTRLERMSGEIGAWGSHLFVLLPGYESAIGKVTFSHFIKFRDKIEHPFQWLLDEGGWEEA